MYYNKLPDGVLLQDYRGLIRVLPVINYYNDTLVSQLTDGKLCALKFAIDNNNSLSDNTKEFLGAFGRPGPLSDDIPRALNRAQLDQLARELAENSQIFQQAVLRRN